ncbi:hypothetical protein N7539_006829 [Penicillium diatomitis]|uniref:Uncharacterized protein n=1 Tax=Penicillium diatomitis TaxID=2819901 RepID=A0A9X0BSB0_9EURO|nr:uncharacterized protein N7539_006829 [Penicillium diatomitis]KAJ5480935.1 hypothetical protein N7539_006829 [Penicillium diatomitis]
MSRSTNRPSSPLAPAAEILVPATPTRRSTLSPSPDLSVAARERSFQSEQKVMSPPALSSSDMTPPPSTQIPGAPRRGSSSRSLSPAAVPFANLEKSLCDAYGASENLPSTEEIDSANETRLRQLAKDLLAVAQEARMSALHFKLQNSLVSFASSEAVKRAEVEQQLAKREVEILRSAEYRSRSRPAEPLTPRPSNPVSHEDYITVLHRSQELENANLILDRRLRHAKRVIDDASARTAELKEQNAMLKRRIQDNRQHFSQLYNYGAMSPSMQNELHTFCRGEHTDGLAALLFADKFTNRIREPHGAYGTQSSVPTTPNQPCTARDERNHSSSSTQARDQYDSDSTVSLSAPESEDEVKRVKPHHEPARITAPKTSSLLQTKLFGQVKKPNVDRASASKRKASSGENSPASKRSRGNAGVGLGIET